MWKLIMELSVRVVDKVKAEFRWKKINFSLATSDFELGALEEVLKL